MTSRPSSSLRKPAGQRDADGRELRRGTVKEQALQAFTVYFDGRIPTP